MKKTKLNLESFRISKLSNLKKIFGGTGDQGGGDGTDTEITDTDKSGRHCEENNGG